MNIVDFIMNENANIEDTLKKIDKNGRGIIFICDDGKRLLAVLSDGDIRRYLLKNGSLENQVSCIANYSPKSLKVNFHGDIKQFIRSHRITAVPLLDLDGCIQKIIFADGKEVSRVSDRISVPVVIMAGGKGTRLYPYTRILPKPLIPVGNKSITEHIMEHFEMAGCTDFSMVVNYKKKLIETYFADEERFHIHFVEEEEFCGTGGGLKLLGNIQETFFMTNCDIILDADYTDIYRRHKEERNIITMVCAKKETEIPYGTVEVSENGQFEDLVEKPRFSFLLNAGFYVIEPDFLHYIPDKEFIHITDVIKKCKEKGERIGIYEVGGEQWMDMGQMDELEKMRQRIGAEP